MTHNRLSDTKLFDPGKIAHVVGKEEFTSCFKRKFQHPIVFRLTEEGTPQKEGGGRRGRRAMKSNDCLDRFFCTLEVREFSEQHGSILEDRRNGEVNSKLSPPYRGQQSKRTPASRA